MSMPEPDSTGTLLRNMAGSLTGQNKERLETLANYVDRLEAERDALKNELDTIAGGSQQWLTDLYAERDALTAQVARLREAITGVEDDPILWRIGWLRTLLDEINEGRMLIADDEDPDATMTMVSEVQAMFGALTEALAETPAHALQQYRNGVLEEAAKKAEDVFERSYREQFEADGYAIAKAIRAMKEGDNGPD